ncbi:hypothetical protein [Sphingomonas sp. UYP23]
MKSFILSLALVSQLVPPQPPEERRSEQPIPLPRDWYPESLAHGPDGTIYVGSWRQGAIARVRPNGNPEVFLPPSSNGLDNVQGLLVDAKAGLLYACTGAIGFTTVPATPSALTTFDLATGAPRAHYLMPDKGHCNDLAQDTDGSIYVTDSFHPRILRLRSGARTLETWIEDPALGSGSTKYYLNGIAIDGRSIYVSPVLATPYVLQLAIERDGTPGRVARISAPRLLRNVDALRVYAPGRLVLFESNAFGGNGPYGGAVTTARVEGNRLADLTTVAAGLNDPSSGFVRDGRVYFIESKYALLMAHPNDDAAIPREVPFDIQSVPLPKG